MAVNRPVYNALLSKHSHIKVYYAVPHPFFRKIINLHPQIPVYGTLGPLRVLYSSNIFVGPSFGPTGPTFLTRYCKSTYFLANRVRKILLKLWVAPAKRHVMPALHRAMQLRIMLYSGFHFRPHMGTSSFFAPKDLK